MLTGGALLVNFGLDHLMQFFDSNLPGLLQSLLYGGQWRPIMGGFWSIVIPDQEQIIWNG
jgi:hypothetical protein